MAVFSVERYGFVSLYDLVSSIGQDLTDNGFTAILDSVSGPVTDATAEAVAGEEIIKTVGAESYSAYGVNQYTITNPGTKYDPNSTLTVTFALPTKTENQIMTSQGWNLTSTSLGGGSFSYTWTKGSLTAINGVASGSVITRATGTVTIGQNGTVTGINITSPGFGYDEDEAVEVTITGNHISSPRLLVESTIEVDPLADTQPWRMFFDLRGVNSPAVTNGQLGIYLGTNATLLDDGTVAYNVQTPNSTTANKIEPAGNTGAQWAQSGSPTPTSMDQCFLNRAGRSDRSVAAAYPMSYRLTITNRGVFLGVWEANAEELGSGFNWLLVQRSVDRLTGETRGSTIETEDGRCPVYCLNCVNNKYYKFVVREKDLIMPSQRKQADANVEDSAAVINSKNQQSLTETGEYVITFISNLNSSRYKYADELDMIGTVSADVVGAGTPIEVTVYGEEEPRVYRALYPNGAYGTGMRLMVLESNPNEI